MPTNSSADPQRGDRVGEQRHEHRRQRAEDRADVGHELHHAVEHPERDRVLAAVGEDPDHAEQVQRETHRDAHDGAEQQLPADVARDRALHEVRVVVGLRAVAVGHHPPHQRADPLAVEQHVHRQHEHEHEVEDRIGHFGQQRAAERCEFAGALGDFVLDALQRRFALFDEVHVDAVLVQFALEGRDLLVGFVDDVRKVVGERPHLIGDRVGEQEADAGQRQEECEVYGEHREPAGKARALQERDGRIEDQRDDGRQ